MKRSWVLLLALFPFGATPALTAPPMKVVYSSGSTTRFDWKWPYHPVQKFTAVQTKPYYYTGRVLFISQEDVSKYRFHYPDRTCRNDWGYFFEPGTKLCPRHPAIIFGAPKAYSEVIYLK
jgi:hypothetical protein